MKRNSSIFQENIKKLETYNIDEFFTQIKEDVEDKEKTIIQEYDNILEKEHGFYLKQNILQHRSVEELQSTVNGKPKYYSYDEHKKIDNQLIGELKDYIRNIVPKLSDYLQYFNEIKEELEQKIADFLKLQKVIQDKLNKFTPGTKNSLQNKALEFTKIDLKYYYNIIDYVSQMITYTQQLKTFYTTGEYLKFLSPTQVEMERKKVEKYFENLHQAMGTNNQYQYENKKLYDVEDVKKLSYEEKIKLLVPYHTVQYGTFKMQRTGEDAYKYLYDLNKDVMVNSIFISNLLKVNPFFKFNYLKNPKLKPDSEDTEVDNNNLVMFIPAMEGDRLKDKKYYNSTFYTVNNIDEYKIDDTIKSQLKELLNVYQKYIEDRNYGLNEILIHDQGRFSGIFDIDNINNNLLRNKNKYIELHKNILKKRQDIIEKYIKNDDRKVINKFKLDKFFTRNYNKLIEKGKCPKISSFENIPIKDKSCEIFEKYPENYPLLNDFLIDKKLQKFKENKNQDRQYVFGRYDNHYINDCSYYFHKRPWLFEDNKYNYNKTYNKNLQWSLHYNLATIYCITNSDLLFPIRFILPNMHERYNLRYKTNSSDNNLEFIGNIIIPFNDNRKNIKNKKKIKHINELFILNIFYYKKYDEIVIYSYNSTVIYNGHLFNGINVSYLELVHSIKQWNMYSYLYIPTPDDKEKMELLKNNYKDYPNETEILKKLYNISDITLFLSVFSPQELINKLKNTLYENTILKRIQPIQIIFPQKGGYYRILKPKFKTLYDILLKPSIYKIDYFQNAGTSLKHEFGKKYYINIKKIKSNYKIKFNKYVNYLYEEIFSNKVYLNILNYLNNITKKYNKIDILKININLFKYYYIYNEHTKYSSKNNINFIKNKSFQPLKEILHILYNLNYNILYFKFIDDNSLNLLEIIINNNILKKDTKIISFSKKLSFVEAYNYQYNKLYKDINVKCYYLEYYLKEDKYLDEVFKLKDFLKKNTFIDIKEPLSYTYIKENFKEKCNIFYGDLFLYPVNINTIFREQMNHQLLISLVFIMIHTLEENGDAIFYLPSTKTKISADIIFILSQLFTNVYFYLSDFQSSMFYLTIYDKLICKNYKGYNKEFDDILSNVVQELDKRDPSGGLNFNVLDEKVRKEFDITKEITKDTPTEYLESIFTFKKEIEPFYKQIKDYHTYRLENLYKNLERIDYYLRNDTPEIEKELKEYQMFNSIAYANRLGLRIKKDINEEVFSDYFGKELLQDMFILDTGIRFKFNKDNLTAEVKKCKTELPAFFKQLVSDMHQSNAVIDTRDPEKYKQVTDMTKLYQTSLGHYIKSLGITYGVNVSRAWTKMYEILHYFPELLPNKKVVKSFHLCEAPGGFILATEYFLKQKDIQLDWKAESLNPKNPINIKKYGNIFADDFGIMKEFPDRWIWGKDDTGDISNPENIKFYKKYCENVDFMTSDCGIDHGKRDEFMEKINFSQFLFMMNNLPKNGNCVLKVFAPVESQKISMIYLMYCRFKKLYFYKPMQNPGSEEFYILAISYETPLIEKELKILFDLLEKYNEEECIVDNIPDFFILQLEHIMRKIADNYDRYIEKKIYYLDNLDKITEKHMKDLKSTIIRKNHSWVREVGLIEE